MPMKFACTACGRSIYTTHTPGDVARCACGAEQPVPEDAHVMSYICRTCGAHGPSPTCVECGGSARPESLSPAQSPTAGRVGVKQPRPDAFRVGRVVSRGMKVWVSNLSTFVPIAFLVYVPLFLVMGLIWASSGSLEDLWFAGPAHEMWIGFSVTGLSLVLGQVVTAIIIYAVFQGLSHRNTAMGKAVTHGLAVLPSVLGVIFVKGLMIVVVLGTVAIPAVLMADAFGAFLFVVGVVLGGLWLLTRLWAAVSVAVVERPGVFKSISRSWELAEGLRSRILGVILLMGLIQLGAGLPIYFILEEGTTAYYLTSQIVGVLSTSLSSVVAAVGYRDLREASDGTETDELVAVFE